MISLLFDHIHVTVEGHSLILQLNIVYRIWNKRPTPNMFYNKISVVISILSPFLREKKYEFLFFVQGIIKIFFYNLNEKQYQKFYCTLWVWVI